MSLLREYLESILLMELKKSLQQWANGQKPKITLVDCPAGLMKVGATGLQQKDGKTWGQLRTIEGKPNERRCVSTNQEKEKAKKPTDTASQPTDDTQPVATQADAKRTVTSTSPADPDAVEDSRTLIMNAVREKLERLKLPVYSKTFRKMYVHQRVKYIRDWLRTTEKDYTFNEKGQFVRRDAPTEILLDTEEVVTMFTTLATTRSRGQNRLNRRIIDAMKAAKVPELDNITSRLESQLSVQLSSEERITAVDAAKPDKLFDSDGITPLRITQEEAGQIAPSEGGFGILKEGESTVGYRLPNGSEVRYLPELTLSQIEASLREENPESSPEEISREARQILAESVAYNGRVKTLIDKLQSGKYSYQPIEPSPEAVESMKSAVVEMLLETMPEDQSGRPSKEELENALDTIVKECSGKTAAQCKQGTLEAWKVLNKAGALAGNASSLAESVTMFQEVANGRMVIVTGGESFPITDVISINPTADINQPRTAENISNIIKFIRVAFFTSTSVKREDGAPSSAVERIAQTTFDDDKPAGKGTTRESLNQVGNLATPPKDEKGVAIKESIEAARKRRDDAKKRLAENIDVVKRELFCSNKERCPMGKAYAEELEKQRYQERLRIWKKDNPTAKKPPKRTSPALLTIKVNDEVEKKLEVEAAAVVMMRGSASGAKPSGVYGSKKDALKETDLAYVQLQTRALCGNLSAAIYNGAPQVQSFGQQQFYGNPPKIQISDGVNTKVRVTYEFEPNIRRVRNSKGKLTTGVAALGTVLRTYLTVPDPARLKETINEVMQTLWKPKNPLFEEFLRGIVGRL